MFKGSKLYMAAVCVALPLLAFYFANSQGRMDSVAAPVSGQTPRARLAVPPGSTQVPITMSRQTAADADRGMDSTVRVGKPDEGMVPVAEHAAAAPELPTAADIQNAQDVLTALLEDGSIPAEEAPRLQRLVQGLGHQMPVDLLRDKPRMSKMLLNYALGHDSSDSGDPSSQNGTGATAEGDSFPKDPYATVFSSPALTGAGASAEEKQQSMDEYLAVTSGNKPNN